jgi:hypothetical protein
VREGRVELPRPFGHRILSPARLPFRHSRDGRTLISVDGGGGAWERAQRNQVQGGGAHSARRATGFDESCDDRRSGSLKAAVGRADARGMGSS